MEMTIDMPMVADCMVSECAYTQATWKCMNQQGEKRPGSRRGIVGLAINVQGWTECRKCRSNFLSSSRFHNEEDGCLSPCPTGAHLLCQHVVAALEKDSPFPAGCALF